MEESDREALKALERDKDRMIRYYMSLQDKADGINEEIYNTCCGIEELNVKIAALQEQLKAVSGEKAPANGQARPASGGTVSRNRESRPPLRGTASSE